jgi:hypothetical protein
MPIQEYKLKRQHEIQRIIRIKAETLVSVWEGGKE